jgi:hypothetical protein
MLQGVHLIRVATQVQMIAMLHSLDEWLEIHPKVRLIDSKAHADTSIGQSRTCRHTELSLPPAGAGNENQITYHGSVRLTSVATFAIS